MGDFVAAIATDGEVLAFSIDQKPDEEKKQTERPGGDG